MKYFLILAVSISFFGNVNAQLEEINGGPDDQPAQVQSKPRDGCG